MAASETVRVIVRCRPMNQRELDLKCRTITTMDTQINQVMLENITQTNEPPKQFTFDAVYAEDSITENLYAESVFPLVESVLEGYNATVFAYGQTGCGKSFTMQGINTPGSPQRGVIPRSFEHIFDASAVATSTKYLIRASYLEIYNESIRDLLGKDVKAALDLKESVDKGIQVQNLTWYTCSSVVDCERLMDKGNRNRATGATLMNKDSSRSHSIFTIVTEMCSRSEVDGKEHIRAGKLNLVDLAGSERQSKTHAEGDRLREATRINLSLSALGNVISALVDGRSKHIPYRDSKLTRLLQDSLGGNTKTLMIAAISPAHDNYDETLSTLRYANRAKNIKNKPRINEDPRDAQMKLLQDEINRLKEELLNAGNPSRGNPVLPPEDNIPPVDREEEIEKERERLRAEYDREVSEIRRQCEAERLTKEEIQRKYDGLKAQYDTELDALNASQNNGDVESAPTGNERNKNKKKGGVVKQRRNGENLPNGQDTDGDGSSTPADPLDQKQKIERLHELENKFVGGEEANNEERKKKRKKKLNDMKEKNEQRKRFNRANKGDDDDTLMKVFDDAQDQLHYTTKKLEEERLDNKRLRNDNADLEYEFQRERENYLNIIREQEKKILLYRTMIDKMSTLVPRSCNYSNVEKIIEQARYDEEKNIYHLPDPTKDEIQLPRMGHSPVTTNGRIQQQQNDYINLSKSISTPRKNEYEDDFIVPNGHSPSNTEESDKPYGGNYDSSNNEESDKRYGRNYDSTNTEESNRRYGQNYDPSNTEESKRRYGQNYDSSNTEESKRRYGQNYDPSNTEESKRRYGQNYDLSSTPPERIRVKRQEQLLNESANLQRTKHYSQMNDNDYMNRRLNPFESPSRMNRKYGFSSDKQ